MLKRRFQPDNFGRQCFQKFVSIKHQPSEDAQELTKAGLAGAQSSDVFAFEIFLGAVRPAFRTADELSRKR